LVTCTEGNVSETIGLHGSEESILVEVHDFTRVTWTHAWTHESLQFYGMALDKEQSYLLLLTLLHFTIGEITNRLATCIVAYNRITKTTDYKLTNYKNNLNQYNYRGGESSLCRMHSAGPNTYLRIILAFNLKSHHPLFGLTMELVADFDPDRIFALIVGRLRF